MAILSALVAPIIPLTRHGSIIAHIDNQPNPSFWPAPVETSIVQEDALSPTEGRLGLALPTLPRPLFVLWEYPVDTRFRVVAGTCVCLDLNYTFPDAIWRGRLRKCGTGS